MATLKAKVIYKKMAGTLELTSTHLQWRPDGTPASTTVQIRLSDANALFCSKDGAAQVKLKLGVRNDDLGHNFTFSNPPTTALVERDKFKKELSTIIANNRVASGPSGPSLHSKPASPSKNAPPSPSPDGPHRDISRGPTPSSSMPINQEDAQVCKRVLLKSPGLAELHRLLVMTGQISEGEFWEGRQHLLDAQRVEDNQRKGRPGKLVDPRPETTSSGDVKIVITPQLVHDIFEEFPVVATAYSENVPKTLSEATFWQRYFQSKLFFSHQASIRSSATQHVVKADPIFDKYLSRADDDIEPLNPREGAVRKIIDLAATREDHHETGNRDDVTMQAGKQKGALPLIRRFNEHSERLLISARGNVQMDEQRHPTQAGSEEVRMNTSHFTYVVFHRCSIVPGFELDDLRSASTSPGITLNIQKGQMLFERDSETGLNIVQLRSNADDGWHTMDDLIQKWAHFLNEFTIEKEATESALASMTSSARVRAAAFTEKNDVPDHLLHQMETCHTAANEFLRQFWLSKFPTEEGSSVPAVQRQAKALKMAGYLSTTHEKVRSIVDVARAGGYDGDIVETAMSPLLNAVDRALYFQMHRS